MIKVDFLTIQIKPEAAFCAAADVKVSKEKKKQIKACFGDGIVEDVSTEQKNREGHIINVRKSEQFP